jgi:pimeloyl-ACP methyl ester carboxylesterase
MIESRFIQFGSDSLHYVKAGRGKTNLLFFHGFGQDHTVYHHLIQTLAPHYTLYICDLYFHGQSRWGSDEQPLEKAHWKKTMQVFLNENGIDNFSLVGFSLGGKFALATMESFPQQCKEIWLIAPDGIKTSFWYSLATYPIGLRKFFKSLIQKPARFLKLANLLNRFNLIDKGLIRFAEYQMNTLEKRKRVYYSWVVFRHLSFNVENLKQVIKENRIRLTVIVGRYDKVIEPENIRPITSGVPNAKFEIVESGHTGLLSEQILKMFLTP